MAKKASTTTKAASERTASNAELQAKVAELTGVVKARDKTIVTLTEEKGRLARKAANADERAKKAEAEAKDAVADAMAPFGPFLVGTTAKAVNDLSGTPLPAGVDVAVLHLRAGLTPDWLESAMRSGRVRFTAREHNGERVAFVGDLLRSQEEALAEQAEANEGGAGSGDTGSGGGA